MSMLLVTAKFVQVVDAFASCHLFVWLGIAFLLLCMFSSFTSCGVREPVYTSLDPMNSYFPADCSTTICTDISLERRLSCTFRKC